MDGFRGFSVEHEPRDNSSSHFERPVKKLLDFTSAREPSRVSTPNPSKKQISIVADSEPTDRCRTTADIQFRQHANRSVTQATLF